MSWDALPIGVRLCPTLAARLGQSALVIEMPTDATVRDLLRAVAGHLHRRAGVLLDAEGDPHPSVRVLVRGQDVPYLPLGLETRLGPGDIVDLLATAT